MSNVNRVLRRIPRSVVFASFVASLPSCAPDSPPADALTDQPVSVSGDLLRREVLGVEAAANAFAAAQTAASLAVQSPDGLATASVELTQQRPESRSFDLVVASGGTKKTVANDVINVGAIAWSPGGRMLAICEGTMISVIEIDTAVKHQVYIGPGGPYPGTCRELEWINDGGQLSFIEYEHAADAELANPQRVFLTIADRSK